VARPITGGRLVLRRSLAARRNCGSCGRSAPGAEPVPTPER
jgi:hypothetical protein